MLPRARKSYGLMAEKYGLMLASYPRVLESQKKLFELQLARYILARSRASGRTALRCKVSCLLMGSKPRLRPAKSIGEYVKPMCQLPNARCLQASRCQSRSRQIDRAINATDRWRGARPRRALAISKSLTAGSKNVDGVTAVCNSENSAGRQIVQKKWGSRLGPGAPRGAFHCQCRFHTDAWGHPS